MNKTKQTFKKFKCANLLQQIPYFFNDCYIRCSTYGVQETMTVFASDKKSVKFRIETLYSTSNNSKIVFSSLFFKNYRPIELDIKTATELLHHCHSCEFAQRTK